MARRGGRLRLPEARPKGGLRLFARAAWMSLWQCCAGYAAAFGGTALGMGAASLLAHTGLVGRLQEFDSHARFADFGPWVILLVTAGMGISLFLVQAVTGLALRQLYLLPRLHVSVGVLTAFAYFLPTVRLNVGWIVLPGALLAWWVWRALERPDPVRIEWLLYKYYRGFPVLQDWIGNAIVSEWVSAAGPQPSRQPASTRAATPAGRPALASSLFDGYLSEMRAMLPRLAGTMVEDEWSRLIEVSERIYEMAGNEPDKYSSLNHFLASQLPNAIKLGGYFVTLGKLTESDPTRAPRMLEIETSLQGLFTQFEKVHNQTVESDLAGLEVTLQLLQEDLQQAEQRRAYTPVAVKSAAGEPVRDMQH